MEPSREVVGLPYLQPPNPLATDLQHLHSTELSQAEYIAKLEKRLGQITSGSGTAAQDAGMPMQKGTACALRRILEHEHASRRERMLEGPMVSSLADPAAQSKCPTDEIDDDMSSRLCVGQHSGVERPSDHGFVQTAKNYAYTGDSSSSDEGGGGGNDDDDGEDSGGGSPRSRHDSSLQYAESSFYCSSCSLQ